MATKKTPAAAAIVAPPRSPISFARMLAKECQSHGIRRTAARARLEPSSLARKVNTPSTLTAADMTRLAPLFGFSIEQ